MNNLPLTDFGYFFARIFHRFFNRGKINREMDETMDILIKQQKNAFIKTNSSVSTRNGVYHEGNWYKR